MISISELYSVIVVVCGISPSYFLDEMQMYEIDACLDGMSMCYKQDWEQCRMITYMIAQTNSTKKLKPSDIISFPWDKEDDTEHDTFISNDDIERLKDKSNKYIQSLKDGGSSNQSIS